MKKLIQDSLLAAYRLARHAGTFDTSWGRSAFFAAYRAYKRAWESDIGFLRKHVPPDTWIVDVGANIGYFSEVFCGWVSGAGRVLCFEPEQRNFDELVRWAKQRHFSDRLVPRRSLVAEIDGVLPLALNADNPADHRIGANGVPTEAVRLDTAMALLDWPRVSLVKVDVQGAEQRVLDGARETLARNRPVLVLEIDDRALRAFGSSARSLEDFLTGLGYDMYAMAEAEQLRSKLGYADFVFMHRSSKACHSGNGTPR
jgi:FkbM family methyltransferase